MLAVMALTLAACASTGDDSRRVQFDCEGTALAVQFTPGRAELTWSDGKDVLDQRPAASGIWYESTHNTLRGKGQEMAWTQDGRARSCRELK